jgi:hypothetical protein
MSAIPSNPPGIFTGDEIINWPDYDANFDNTLSQVGDPNHIAYHNHTIARWVAPLFKDYDVPTKIPLLAYHISGIDRVEFQMNKGDIQIVTEMEYNESAGVTCYNFTIPPNSPDREMNELRAKIFPVSGWPQVLQGEVMDGNVLVTRAVRNLKFGHFSFFFATNFNKTLPRKEFYINIINGDDLNPGTSPDFPKRTMESALVAAGGTGKQVDGTILYLMDDGSGNTVDYELGTNGISTFQTTANKLNNLKRYVTITPFQNSNVNILKKGNSGGLALNKYRFLNLNISQQENLESDDQRIFKLTAPLSKTFVNTANGKTYQVTGITAKHLLIENCFMTANFQRLFDWEKVSDSYVRVDPVLDVYGNIIPPELNFSQAKVPGESTQDYRFRRSEWLYRHSGWTFNPNWANDDDETDKFFEGQNFESRHTQTLFAGVDFGAGCMVGCTLTYIGNISKNTSFYLFNNVHVEKWTEDGIRDVGCIVNMTAKDSVGHPINIAFNLDRDFYGLGFSGERVTDRGHADALQIFPGQGNRSRNSIFKNIKASDYWSQGPFISGGSVPGITNTIGQFLDPGKTILNSIGQQFVDNPIPIYETMWSIYDELPVSGSTNACVMRDVVFDDCSFVASSGVAAAIFIVSRGQHGNIIVKDCVFGKDGEIGGSFRYDGVESTTQEINAKESSMAMRPSLIQRSYSNAENKQNPQARLFPTTSQNTPITETHGFEKWLSEGGQTYWISPRFRTDVPGSVIIYDFREVEEETTPGPEQGETGTPPTPILNHPITVRLSTTDITKEMSWSRKDHLDNSAGTTHGPDGIYPSSDLIQIPNYLERIEEVTDPNSSPEIGSSVNTEIIGNTFGVGNQGGVYVTGGVADFILSSSNGTRNSLDITNISTIYLNKARKNNGLTMSLILHGKSVPGTSMAEFKYIAAEPQQFGEDGLPLPDFDIDEEGNHYTDFYKKFAYIAFNSRESQVTQSITSNQFSFRKSPHHTFVQFNRAEIDGLSLSNVLNGTSIMDMVTPIDASKLAKIQTAAIGCTCTFNSNTTANESTSAERIDPASSTTLPSIITCKNITMEYLGSEANGNQIRFKNKFPVSMFSGRVVSTTYQHNGAVAAFNQTFQFLSSVNDYRIPAPAAPLPGEQGQPEPTINLRFINPVGSGSKNLLAYKVASDVRLFGGTNNIGITAGSYIRISGSPNNNGIYQVKNMFDGIDGDTASNTALSGLPEFQYLELSRTITAQEQSGSTEITVENVSHLPILHIKYRQPS